MKKTKPVSDLSLFASLFDDIGARDNDLHQPLTSRDLPWLKKLVKTRGVPFIMIDMPEAGKILDQALSHGRLDPSLLPATFGKEVSGGSRQFLYCLFSRIFDEEGRLKQDADVSDVRHLRQVLYLAKKAKMVCSDAAIQAEVDAFRVIDQRLRSPTLNWDDDEFDGSQAYKLRLSVDDVFDPRADLDFDFISSNFTPAVMRGQKMTGELTYGEAMGRLLKMVQSVADNLMSRWSTEFDWRDVYPKHGPGVVADARRGTDKYLFPTWPSKLERVFPHSYFACSAEKGALALSEETIYFPNREPPVRLLAVPKTLKGPRMVASEPTSHQFIQLGLMRWMRENLPAPLAHTLDFRDQEPSRASCLRASRGGHSATVDLSAASDRLSCWLVERIFRRAPALLEALHASRSRWIFNATRIGDPYFLRLKKYAPMGNGTTFPVQSIVYAVIAIASTLFWSRTLVTNRSIDDVVQGTRVFGDDIILPSCAVIPLANALSYFQLKVNWMKTHSTGTFRESCGMDAFNGLEVTPLYLASLELKETPEGISSWLDVLRNAHDLHYHHLAAEMEKLIPQRILDSLPRSERVLGCLSLPAYYGESLTIPAKMKRRYNRKLFRWEILALSIVPKPVRVKRETDANLVQYWTDSPKPDSQWESGFVSRNRNLTKLRWVPVS